jgi:hypothetical protein
MLEQSVYKQISKDYSIVTMARVGSFYLQDRILQHTGVYIKKYHTLKDNKMITVVRDPIDMLTSKLAMTAFYDKNNETLDHIRNSSQGIRDLQVYREGLRKIDIEKDFDIIIDYRDLMSNPFETTKAISHLINLPIINEEYKENTIKDNPKDLHLVSSKMVEGYAEIKEYVEKLDLSDLYEAYHKALDKCIKVA